MDGNGKLKNKEKGTPGKRERGRGGRRRHTDKERGRERGAIQRHIGSLQEKDGDTGMVSPVSYGRHARSATVRKRHSRYTAKHPVIPL
jgi:hypothetical protein